VLTVLGFAAAVAGLLDNNLAPESGHELFGLPAPALAVFLIGAATLRLLRSVPDPRG
jgi:hypothetical protein